MNKSTIWEGKIIVILIFLFIISLTLIKIFEKTENILIDISFCILIVSMFMIPVYLSFYILKLDNNTKQKRWNQVIFNWLMISLLISFLIQEYLKEFDPFHSWQISLDMVWPFYAPFYIIWVLAINIMANLLIKTNN